MIVEHPASGASIGIAKNISESDEYVYDYDYENFTLFEYDDNKTGEA